jgi:hypothetical protein
MAFRTNGTDHCRLCGKALPREGFSSQVAGVFLSPLCADCEPRCTTDPDRVMAEYPRVFERPAAREITVLDPSSCAEDGPPMEHYCPRLGTHPPSSASMSDSPVQHVIITDIHMPLTSMVKFTVRWTIASIPATMILGFLGFIASALLRALLGGFGPMPFTTRQF